MTTDWIVETGLFAGFRPPPRPGGTEYIVIHCSATPESMDIGAREIDGWHRSRGWLGCGYHYVIRRDGIVERARPEHMQGAHAESVNAMSIGVCLVGGVNAKGKAENNFTQDQWQSLTTLVLELVERYPAVSVLGHRDLPGVKKDCPSFDVRRWYRDICL
jgi:N-acetylmuramoyl-L-alanine amidase